MNQPVHNHVTLYGNATTTRFTHWVLLACGLIGLWLGGLWTVVAAQPPQPPAQAQNPPTPTDPATPPATGEPAQFADEDKPYEDLPVLKDKPLPSYERLLKGPAIDWLIFVREERVLEVNPVTPRPNTLQVLDELVKASARKTLPAGPERDAEIERRKDLPYLVVTIVENDQEQGTYRVHQRHLKQIIHYEDLLLRRIDALLAEKQSLAVFELLRVLQQRSPTWPGIAPRRERLQFLEALQFLERDQPETAWNYLLQLHGRNPQFEGLDRQLGIVTDLLMQAAQTRGDARQVRHYLARLRSVLPQQEVVRRWDQQLDQQARAKLQAAETADQAQDWPQAVTLLEQAAAVWPDTPPLTEAAKRIWPRHQRLRVGVLDLANQSTPAPGALARERVLLQRNLFEPFGMDTRGVRYSSRFIEEWEPTDLGRSIVFRMPSRPAGGEPILASRLAEVMAARLSPDSTTYDERFGSYVSGVQVTGPYEFQVDFWRAPLKPEAILQFPIAQASELSGQQFARQPFTRTAATATQSVYRRLTPQAKTLVDWSVAEIVERKYPDNEALKQGWVRGEISCLPHVALWDVPVMSRLPDSQLLEYALPVTHFLQFHPRHPALKLAAFRKALAYGLNRKGMLDGIVLRKPDPTRGRLVSAPYATTHSAYNSLVAPLRSDVRLAMAMLLAAKKDLGGDLPTLRLGVPDNPLEQAVGQELCQQWKQLGLDVRLVTVGPQIPFDIDAEPAAWDLLYRSERMIEPLVDLWPSLTLDRQARIGRLNHLPDWLRTKLISLDQVGDWPAAEQILRETHRDLVADVTLIPLWEVSDYLLIRQNLRGLPARPLYPYQDIERWQLLPWFPKDPL